MDKISSILTSSKSKVDMSKERPVRAGAPSYGQPISEATQTFAQSKVSTQEEDARASILETKKLLTPDVARHTGMIDKITLSFKGNSERVDEPALEQVIDLSSLEATPLESEESALPSIDVYA